MLYTKLIRLDAPFVVTPRAATGSLQNCRRDLGPNSANPTICGVGWFWDPNHQIPPRVSYHVCVMHDQTHVLPVLDRAGNTIHSAISLHECVPRVSASTIGHPTTSVCQPSPSARPSPLTVHCHKPAWPSSSPSATIPVFHISTLQGDRHGCTYIISHSVSPLTIPECFGIKVGRSVY
jgi:hypothetical protein